MIYFDNAATTFPKPGCVVQAVQQAMLYYGANPGRGGHDLSMQTGQDGPPLPRAGSCPVRLSARAGGVHQKLHRIAQYRHQGTGAAGDHFIISDLEHNAVYRVVEQLRRQGIIEYSVAAVEENEQKTVWNFEHLIRPEHPHDRLHPGIQRLWNAGAGGAHRCNARCRGVMMTVDAAQSAGLLPLDLRRQAIDYLCLPGHKGLYGPAGTGLLIVNCPGAAAAAAVRRNGQLFDGAGDARPAARPAGGRDGQHTRNPGTERRPLLCAAKHAAVAV